jgi:rubrerythrin
MPTNRLLKNLAQAYVGESQARMRYTEYAKIAKNAGYVQISQIFSETADHEKTHGKNFFRMIQKVSEKLGKSEEMFEIDKVNVPIVRGTVIDNLKAAIQGEHHEHSEMYPKIAKIAKEEGFSKLAVQINAIAKAEEHHEHRYQKLLDVLENASVFVSEEKVWWLCMECGYWHYGEKPPEMCPSCNHPKAYFKKIDENF